MAMTRPLRGGVSIPHMLAAWLISRVTVQVKIARCGDRAEKLVHTRLQGIEPLLAPHMRLCFAVRHPERYSACPRQAAVKAADPPP